MDKILFIQTGTGIDMHGQDITNAAVKAVDNAINFNSMPGIEAALPNQSLDNMKVKVKLAVPRNLDQLDKAEVTKSIPFGKVEIEVMEGGMATTSGIILEEEGDSNEMMYLVNAAVEVGY
ncbi:hypothetical protein D8M04_09535 [Oceanobacillus piezotolerans]|uniref:Lin0512 family protein n=1 Tax=Oceanobacillus piezotolerans TaxID=2448030 RepID=A0A498D8Z6_9BACI|nr:Lin0512 family protein [Oceanobacillus piezotolerans]RLL45101.1 hypothetical protein D8M04_09535 [Oceanobacillus piezotolerans]